MEIVRRSKDANGNIIGIDDDNMFSNTVVYAVEFIDGEVKIMFQKIVESVYSQIYSESYVYELVDALLDFKKRDYIPRT